MTFVLSLVSIAMTPLAIELMPADGAAQSAANSALGDQHCAVHRAATVRRFVGGGTRTENCPQAGIAAGRSGLDRLPFSYVGDAPGAPLKPLMQSAAAAPSWRCSCCCFYPC